MPEDWRRTNAGVVGTGRKSASPHLRGLEPRARLEWPKVELLFACPLEVAVKARLMKLRIAPPMGLLFGLCAVLFTGVAAKAAEFTGEAKVLAQQDDAWSASSGKRDVDLLVSFYADDAIGNLFRSLMLDRVYERLKDAGEAT